MNENELKDPGFDPQHRQKKSWTTEATKKSELLVIL
jgi:hypothetical protein